ncbi:MAG: photosynthetic complex assembly protein PuhC [Acidocella sp.]|nr:photosynthetic complex assembly protein PuhC [Acidocella sp.]
MTATATAPFPRLQLTAVATVLALVLVASATARFTGFAKSQANPSSIIATTDVTFSDMPDGSVAIRNVRGSHIVVSIPARAGGFVRSTMRVLATERLHEGIGQAQPFRLIQLQNGTFELNDPATGQTLDLVAFGPTNEAEFANIFFASEAQK